MAAIASHLSQTTRKDDMLESGVRAWPERTAARRPRATAVTRVEKPWGYELIYAVTEYYCGKLLFVRSGEALSLQYHDVKDETLYVQSGRAEIEVGALGEASERLELEPGDGIHLRPRTVHR